MAEKNRGQKAVEKWVNYSIKSPRVVYRYLFFTVTAALVVLTILPLYYTLNIALTPSGQATEVGLTPAGFNPHVFVEIFQVLPLHRYIFNSLVIAGMTTAIVLVFASLAGYAFGRLDFRGKRSLFLVFLVVSYFPGASFLIPLFRFLTGNITVMGISSPDLFNTPGAVIVPLTALSMPLAIFLLTVFYSEIPDGLEDAARATGSTRIGALYRVIAPLSMPGLVTAGVLTFITAYNEFLFSFLMVNGQAENWSPIIWGIYSYQLEHATNYNLMAAASLVGLIPVIILLVFAQDKIVRGLAGSSIKG